MTVRSERCRSENRSERDSNPRYQHSLRASAITLNAEDLVPNCPEATSPSTLPERQQPYVVSLYEAGRWLSGCRCLPGALE